jgi:hypothetical protein
MLSRGLNATNRPSYESLKEDNIIVDSGKAKELEKAMATDKLKVGLEKRADADDLKEKGVLKTPKDANKASLEKNMAKDKLAKEVRMDDFLGLQRQRQCVKRAPHLIVCSTPKLHLSNFGATILTH